ASVPVVLSGPSASSQGNGQPAAPAANLGGADSPAAMDGSSGITGTVRQVSLGGTMAFPSGSPGTPGGSHGEEFAHHQELGDTPGGGTDSTPPGRAPLATPAAGAPKAKSNPELAASFDGINAYQQRYANNGNQFQFTPPDQGLAVGKGFVL